MNGNLTGVETGRNEGPRYGSYELFQSVPSPARGSVRISYQLPLESEVSLNVYDITGRLVRKLVSGREAGGIKSVVWDGKDNNNKSVSSGIYFYRLNAGSWTDTKKVVLVK